ncbi:MAG: TMEM165/GDT1 family protein [Cyanobacteria bacterium P01_A01_bin.135]
MPPADPAPQNSAQLEADDAAGRAEESEQASSATPDENTEAAKSMGGLKLFLTTFVTIFVAEIGDKTQVTTLLMSAESRAPLTVFLGAGSALILTTSLGIGVGRWLSKRVSTRTLETATGALLMIISLLLLWDVVTL